MEEATWYLFGVLEVFFVCENKPLEIGGKGKTNFGKREQIVSDTPYLFYLKSKFRYYNISTINLSNSKYSIEYNISLPKKKKKIERKEKERRIEIYHLFGITTFTTVIENVFFLYFIPSLSWTRAFCTLHMATIIISIKMLLTSFWFKITKLWFQQI